MQYLSYTDTRNHLAEALNTVEAGIPIGIQRRETQVTLIESKKLQEVLMGTRLLGRPEAVAEAGGWSVFLPGAPVAADGANLDEAVDEFISALRQYVEDWETRLRLAPNHQRRWPLVLFASLSSDADIAEWVRGNPQ